MDRPADLRDLLSHAAWLRRLAHHLARGTEEAADDLVQEAWVAALRSPPSGARPARPWFAQVLRNAFRKRHRDVQRLKLREAEFSAPAVALPSAEDLLDRAETQQRLGELVLALDEPYRTTVLLRYFEDVPPLEIARRSGEPAGTVRWRLNEALRRLRAAIAAGERGQDTGLRALLPLVSFETPATFDSSTKGALAVTVNANAKVGAAALVTALAAGVVVFSPAPAPPHAAPGIVRPVASRRGTTAATPRSQAGSTVLTLIPGPSSSSSSAPYKGEVPFPSAMEHLVRGRTLWGQVVQGLGWLAGEDPQTLGAIYQDEARHVEWAQAMETLLRQRFVAAGIEDVVVECRQSACRIDLEYPTSRDMETRSAKSPLPVMFRTTGPLASAISDRSDVTEGPTGPIEHVRAFIAFSGAEIDPNKYRAWVHQAHQNWTAGESKGGR
jgi:RNA polymerase sigma factor (sigma-70 family)